MTLRAPEVINKLRDKEIEPKPIEPEQSEPESPAPVLLSFSIPQSNPNFTGREDILAQLRTALTSGQVGAWKQALTGLGGKGKSQIAAEYAHRYQSYYKYRLWLRSEEPAELAANYAGLASELDLPEKSLADQTVIITAVKRWLGDRPGWLLIFDNAGSPEEIEQYLPREGIGHAIITSRNPNWGGTCGVIPIEVFEREESIKFLLKRTKQEDEKTADKLADSLGDLPLALEQAGAYIEASAISLGDYLKLFQEHPKEILSRGKPAAYPETVATTWGISFKAVEEKSLEAADLLKLFSFLAPDDIPKSLLIEGAAELPEPLGSAIKDGIRLNDSIAALRRYSLITINDNLISIHRLVQAVMLDRLSEEEKKKWAEAATKLINGAFPRNILTNPESWSRCSILLPHSLALAGHAEKLSTGFENAGPLLNQTGLYLRTRGEFANAKMILERALEIDLKVYGQDHPDVAIDLSNLGNVLQDLGDLQGAKKNYERALEIFRNSLGENHPKTRTVQDNLNVLENGK